MTIFDQYREHPNSEIRHHLLWEYDLGDFDWQRTRGVVVERVLERGNLEDYYAAINLYGGMENFKKIIREEVRYLSDFDMHFACLIFGLKKEDLLCYRLKQLREKRLNS